MFFKHKYIYAGEDEVHECTAAATIYSFAVCSFYTIVHLLECLYLLTIRVLYTYLYMYINNCICIYLYDGFRSVVFSELRFSMLVTFVLKTCHLVSLILFFFFPSGVNKPSLRYSNPSSNDLERGRRRREGRLDDASQNKTHDDVLLCHTCINRLRSKVWLYTGNLQPEPPPHTFPCVSLCVFFCRRNRPTPNYNTTQPMNRVLVYGKRTHSSWCPVADSHSTVGLNHKKTPQASGLIVRHLTSSWLHWVPQPLLLFFLRITCLKSTGFPKKRALPTAGCRVSTMCVSPPPCPRASHPSTLPRKPDMSYLLMNEADGIIHGDDDALEYIGVEGRTH